jgi:hypothetical protein
MLFCPPRRNNPALGLGHLGVDHGDLKIVHDPDGVNSNLTVVKAVILLQRWAVKNPDRVLGRKFMASKAAILSRIRKRSSSIRIYIMYVHRSGRKKETARETSTNDKVQREDVILEYNLREGLCIRPTFAKSAAPSC